MQRGGENTVEEEAGISQMRGAEDIGRRPISDRKLGGWQEAILVK